MAYRLIELVFSEDVDGLDYTPVTVMLGNFLEGLLNDTLMKLLKKYLPNTRIKMRNGSYGYIKDYNSTMTIGGFAYIFKYEDISPLICSVPNSQELNLNQEYIEDFTKKLVECHSIRNKADHPGEITTYTDKNKFVSNMFLRKNSMLQVMCNLSRVSA